MLPRGLLPGTPIEFDDVQVGDVIDTYDPIKEGRSRFHRRFLQTVTGSGFSCDIDTDYDMFCVNMGLMIQLRRRPRKKDEDNDPR